MKLNIKTKDKNGITLVALVVTVLVLIVLAGVSINLVIGNNGIATKAQIAKTSTELAKYKEELSQWKINKKMEDNNFIEDTLSAGKNNLAYGGVKQEGNIKTIIQDLDDSYLDEVEIIKGELIINTTNKSKLEGSKVAEVSSNPYIIKDGELKSAGTNLELMSSDGTVTIPENVTKIGAGAFSGVEGLRTIVIPGNVEEIGEYAFAYNKTLENVIIGEGVKTIGGSAFDGVTNLKEISLTNSLTYIGSRAFRNTGLEQINIPGSLKTILDSTFDGCKNLSKIYLNEGTKELASGCFAGAIIEEIALPTTITTINAQAFSGCLKLSKINLGKNENFVYESGFLMNKAKNNILFASSEYLKSINTLEIPEGILSFNFAISKYENITKIIIPNSLSELNANSMPTTLTEVTVKAGNKTFTANNGFLCSGTTLTLCYSKETNIEIPNGIKKIGYACFNSATKAVSIKLSETVEEIGDCRFQNNFSMNIGKNVNKISPLFVRWQDANITVDKENQYFSVENNILYDKDKKKLIRVLYQVEDNIKINKNVETIGEYAFYNRQRMKNLKLQEGITTLEARVFTNCPNLEKIEIPTSLTSIGTNCFGDATSNLSEIIIHKKENSISGSPWGVAKGERAIKWVGEK